MMPILSLGLFMEPADERCFLDTGARGVACADILKRRCGSFLPQRRCV